MGIHWCCFQFGKRESHAKRFERSSLFGCHQCIVSSKWLSSDPSEIQKPNFDTIYRILFDRWRVGMILRHYPRSDWEMLFQKTVAFELLKNKRHEWGIGRRWEGNYLRKEQENDKIVAYKTQVRDARQRGNRQTEMDEKI